MKKFRIVMVLTILSLILFSNITAFAAASNPPVGGGYTITQNTTHYYSCKAHSYNCHQVTFTSQGNTSTHEIYDKYFSSNTSHWPNAFRYDNVWITKTSTLSYAKGTYTIYSSLITKWASLSFASTSKTISHVY